VRRAAASRRRHALQELRLLFDFDRRSRSSSIASTGGEGREDLAEDPGAVELRGGNEELLLARAERLMSSEGNIRLSVSFRSRTISALPVPLNSSKITSSIRDPSPRARSR